MSLRLVESTFNGNLTMTSKDIADLVESRHDKVKQSIERLVNRGVIELPPMGEIKTVTKPVMIYRFSGEKGKRDSIIVVAQLSPEFTARLVDRWGELEQAATETKFVIPQTYAEALRLAADQAEQIALMAPKVEVYNAIVERDHALTATQVGNKIGLSAVKLNRALGELGVFNNTVKRGRAFRQWFVDEGYGVMRKSPEGYDQALFTNKGEAWIVNKLIKIGLIQSDIKVG